MLLMAMLLAGPQPCFPPQYELPQGHCFVRGKGIPIVSAFERDWYGQHLRAAKEPSLYALAKRGTADSLRFTWLRCFHAPVIVRVDGLAGPRPRLRAIRLSGQGTMNPATWPIGSIDCLRRPKQAI